MNDAYIREVKICNNMDNLVDTYPYNLPVIKNLQSIKFHPKVTYFVGENGTGKSTLLEAIAIAYGFNAEGGSKNFTFSTRNTHSKLWEDFKLIKGARKPKDGFFFRAESFYNLASNVDDLQVNESYGGKSLHKQSHGEAFISLLMNRFKGNGVYILDEPEAALSPSRQMVFLARINDLVKKGSQFIITTHSPIILAYPDSKIYEMQEDVKEVNYEETETYQIMKSFVNNPKKMLDILF